MHFDSHADRTVATTVGLVNAVVTGQDGGRPARVPEPSDAAGLAGAITAALPSNARGRLSRVAPADALRLAGVVSRLRAVFEAADVGDVAMAAEIVNEVIRATEARPVLTSHDGQDLHLHYQEDDADPAAAWGAGCAASLAVVIGSGHADRLGVCSAQRCDRVFVDTSRSGTRRFCGLSCQNRAKAAAYRARQAS